MKTLSYIYAAEEEIEIGNTYYFGQLWDGEGEGYELLESGSIEIDDTIVEFKVLEKDNDDILKSIVEVTEL